MQRNITVISYKYNHIPRYEDLTGEKPDLSHFDPLYAQGVSHETRSQRKLHGGSTFIRKQI
jgi:hypothetical protein